MGGTALALLKNKGPHVNLDNPPRMLYLKVNLKQFSLVVKPKGLGQNQFTGD